MRESTLENGFTNTLCGIKRYTMRAELLLKRRYTFQTSGVCRAGGGGQPPAHAVLGGVFCEGLNPQPSTLNPQPSTLNLQPSTLNPQPSTFNP